MNLFKILSYRAKKVVFGGSGKGDVTSFEILFTTDETKKEKVILKCQKGQSELTAFSTVLHIEKILENAVPAGIYFSHQLHRHKAFISSLIVNKTISIY